MRQRGALRVARRAARELNVDGIVRQQQAAQFCESLILVVATELTIQANLEERNLDEGTFLFFLAVYFVFVIAWLVQTFRIFRIPDA